MKHHCKSFVDNKSYLKGIVSGVSSLKLSNKLCNAWMKEIFPDWTSLSPQKFFNKYDISVLLSTHLLCTSPLFIKHFSKGTLKDKCFGPFFDYLHKKHGKFPPYDKVCLLVAGLLYGQLAYPSFPVLSKLLRLQYTAKKRQMFCDVIIFDKCRYIYEQFPTVDCACFAINEQKQRVVICMIVAFLRKHLENVCQDVFNGCDFLTLYPEMSGLGGVSLPNIPQYSLGEREVIDKHPRGVLWYLMATIFFLIVLLSFSFYFKVSFVFFIYFLYFSLIFNLILFYFLCHFLFSLLCRFLVLFHFVIFLNLLFFVYFHVTLFCFYYFLSFFSYRRFSWQHQLTKTTRICLSFLLSYSILIYETHWGFLNTTWEGFTLD